MTTNQQAVNQAATVKYAFIENPFESDFNPGEPLGQKLFLEATIFDLKEEDKFSINFENTTKLLDLFSSLSNKFGWARLIEKVKVGTDYKSILKNHRVIPISDVQKQAESYFAPGKHASNPATDVDFNIEQLDPETNSNHRKCFYDRVKSNVIAKAIFQHLSAGAIKSLSLDKAIYTWSDANGNEKMDGPTLLKLILSKLAPSTVLGVQKLREKISSSRLKDFDYNVISMIDSMQNHFEEILSHGGTMDTYNTAVFDALLSGSDSNFNTWVVTQQNKFYEDSTSFKIEALIMGAKNQYTNLLAMGQWRKQETILAALATRIQQLESTKGKVSTQTNTKNDGDVIPGTTIEKWRSIKTLDSVNHNGKTYHWCKHHVSDGKYNGLYVSSHDEAHHDLWRSNNRGSNRQQKIQSQNPFVTSATQSAISTHNSDTQSSVSNSGAQSMASNKQQITLNDKMRSVLLTKAGLTEKDIEQLFQGN